jgi:hypothetical protein
MGADLLAKRELFRLRGARELRLLNGRGGQRSRDKRLFRSVPARECPPLRAEGLSQPRKRAGQNGGRPKNCLRFALPYAMSKPRRNVASLPPDDTLYAVKQRKPVPHEFVLDQIAPLSPRTRFISAALRSMLRTRSSLSLSFATNATRRLTTACGSPPPRSTTRACGGNSPHSRLPPQCFSEL